MQQCAVEIAGTGSTQCYPTLFGWEMQMTGTSDHARVAARASGLPGAMDSSSDGGPGQLLGAAGGQFAAATKR